MLYVIVLLFVSLGLASLVADEQWQLYRCFNGTELQALLTLCRQSVITFQLQTEQ